MKPWRQIDETETIHDGWRKIYRKTFLMNNGTKFVAEVGDKEGAAGVEVIALTPGNKVIIARQFRVGPGKVMEELPGGFAEPGEDLALAARRELLEETGYEAGKLTKLGEVYKNSYLQSKTHYYLAENCRFIDGAQKLDIFEEVEVDLISISKFFENAHTSMMTDTEALFFAYDKLKELERSV